MLKKSISVLSKVTENISMICMALMTAVTLVMVFYRYVLVMPLVWGGSVSRYLMIWMVLVGAGALLRKRGHIYLGLIVEKLPGTFLRKATLLFSDLVALGFSLYILYAGYIFLTSEGERKCSTLGISMVWVYAGFVVFSILLVIFSMENIMQTIRNKKD